MRNQEKRKEDFIFWMTKPRIMRGAGREVRMGESFIQGLGGET